VPADKRFRKRIFRPPGNLNILKTVKISKYYSSDQDADSQNLLPICSYCKKARNSEGCWEKLEAYLLINPRVELTHGICPECMARLESEIRSFIDNVRAPARSPAMIFAPGDMKT